jgi:hypothetical protein
VSDQAIRLFLEEFWYVWEHLGWFFALFPVGALLILFIWFSLSSNH